MSNKRFFPQQHGERKKAKLNVTISDHNFPLSQNPGANNDNWGDDNDDEILLMASQACEQAYSNNNSTLPDFSMCMQPAATSTQMFPQPGPSNTQFTFKKPSTNSPQITSVQLKDKCHRISSPLPGMSSKITTSAVESLNYKDDLIYNDKVYKGQDTDHIYRQLLQLQEENAKLKSENGKLLDKCVTKEGEASILRTQLKTCQIAVDNARMEKIRAQEKVQMEFTEKLTAVTEQMHDLKTQLDFKNLEIISVKEKCRMLESTKIKLTQVTVPNSDISSSHRHNINSTCTPNMPQRRVKMTSNAAQTDGKAHFLKLNIGLPINPSSKLTAILPLILEPTFEQPCLLDYNENLQTDMNQSQRNCGVFSTFHRIPATPTVIKSKTECKITMNCIHEDLSGIADGINVGEKFDKIVKGVSAALRVLRRRVRGLLGRAGAPFRRDMAQRHVAAAAPAAAPRARLLAGRALYKEEQAMLARRMVAVLAYILEPSRKIIALEQVKLRMDYIRDELLQIISDICNLLDTASCGTLYSGLLDSICGLLLALPLSPLSTTTLKSIIACRPMPFALRGVLKVLRRLAAGGVDICARSGNIRIDFEQGVLLYKKDSCHLYVLLKQVEVALKCIEKQNLVEEALSITQNLLAFYSNSNAHNNLEPENTRCECQLVLMQVLIFALRICSVMVDDCKSMSDETRLELRAACDGGAVALLGGAEGPAALAAAEGPCQELCERARRRRLADLQENMLFELSATFQCAVEDSQPSYHRQAWVKSFENFSLAD